MSLLLVVIQLLLFLFLDSSFIVEPRFRGLLGALSTEPDSSGYSSSSSMSLLLGMPNLSRYCSAQRSGTILKTASSHFEMNRNQAVLYVFF